VKIPEDMVVGTIHESNKCGTFEILEYTNCNNITVQFTTTGFITTKTADQVRRGQVKDYYHPTVAGVGYLGKGPYTCTKDKRAYQTWVNMIKRCYSSSYQYKNPTYRGCTVNKKWHCFQDFAPWFYSNYIEGYHLDKDIIGTGKEYSPSNCIFVTQEDNMKHAMGTFGVSWVLTNISTGEDITITSQSGFAKEQGLGTSSVNKLCSGKLQASQGFKLKEVRRIP
jgi:hypothetical protein